MPRQDAFVRGTDLPPRVTSWEAAVASRNLTTVEQWYAANTGHEALGIAYGNLVAGSLTSSADGQVIEGIKASTMVVQHNNVTFRGCRVEGGATYGARTNPTFGSTFTGTVIEHCTLDGGVVDKAGSVWSSTVDAAHTMRNCNFVGWSSGILGQRGIRAEYCWFHDFIESSVAGAHVTCGLAEGQGCHYYRNFGQCGGSGVFNMYFDKRAVHNSSIIENVMTGELPSTPAYFTNMKDDPAGVWDVGATNIKIKGNYYGVNYQFGYFSGAPVPWNTNGNELTGNQIFATGELTGNA